MLLPFGNSPLLRADNIDDALRVFHQVYRDGDLEVPGKKLKWIANAVPLGSMRIAVGYVDSPLFIRSPPSGKDVFLMLSRKGNSLLGAGKKEFAITPSTGVFLSPSVSAHYSIPENFFPLTVILDYSTLTSELRALTGIHSPKPLEFECAFDASSPNGAQIRRLLRFIIKTINQSPSLLSNHLVMANLENAFRISLLLGQPHNHQTLLLAEPKTPAVEAVRKAEAYLDAHANRPICMADLAAEAGVSVRALQAAFKAQRGLSPMAFLKERRLELSRKRLSLSVPGTSVTDVALDCGFRHLGRFSSEYLKRFGESPSDTLQRALGEGRTKRGRKNGVD